MDPAADKDQALENNYTLKVNKKETGQRHRR